MTSPKHARPSWVRFSYQRLAWQAPWGHDLLMIIDPQRFTNHNFLLCVLISLSTPYLQWVFPIFFTNKSLLSHCLHTHKINQKYYWRKPSHRPASMIHQRRSYILRTIAVWSRGPAQNVTSCWSLRKCIFRGKRLEIIE